MVEILWMLPLKLLLLKKACILYTMPNCATYEGQKSYSRAQEGQRGRIIKGMLKAVEQLINSYTRLLYNGSYIRRAHH